MHRLPYTVARPVMIQLAFAPLSDLLSDGVLKLEVARIVRLQLLTSVEFKALAFTKLFTFLEIVSGYQTLVALTCFLQQKGFFISILFHLFNIETELGTVFVF